MKNDNILQNKLKCTVELHKNRVAISYGNKSITYDEINKKSLQITKWLASNGYNKETKIGLYFKDRSDLITAIIAVLRAGGIFIPLDIILPIYKIKDIISFIQPDCIISDDSEFLKTFENEKGTINHSRFYSLNEVYSQSENTDEHIGELVNYLPEDKIYIYFTSGSTGKPKSIIGSNKGLLHFINWEINTFGLSENDNISQLTNPGFDVFLRDVFTTLCAGATLCIPHEREIILDHDKLKKWINENKISLIHCVPSLFGHLISSDIKVVDFQKLKYILLAGEKPIIKDLQKWYQIFNDRIQLVNLYGPTETTLAKACYFISKTDLNKSVIPIGKPLPGSRFIILDENKQVCKELAVGEIYIRTPYRSHGYYNDPVLNKKSFIINPFNNDENDIIYKTGDLGRLLSDGNIELLGRVDRQVKIRGNRIELEEIEKTLLDYESGFDLNNISSEYESSINDLNKIKRCKKCLLPSTFPSIEIDNQGVCSVCNDDDSYKKIEKQYFKDVSVFKSLMSDLSLKKKSEYDCLLLFSGGKDSSYVLYKLVEFGYKVLTFTFDNGYISDSAFQNIERITNQLNVDHITFSSDKMNELFIESLNKESTVCHGCWKALSLYSTQLASEKGINVIINGLSRGQIFDTKIYPLVKENIYENDEIENKLLMFRKIYHSMSDEMSRILNVNINENVFNEISFLDYFRYDETSIANIKGYLKERKWVQPSDTGFCSSNCIINDVGIFTHLKRKKYHNYAAPLSWDIRLGNLERNEGLNELGIQINIENVCSILQNIGYIDQPIKNVIVIKKEAEGIPFLCAYYISDHDLDKDRIESYMKNVLPDYMIPTYYVKMEKFPLTINEKIDVKKLPNPLDIIEQEYQPPRNSTEERLARIWENVLDKKQISINAKFFNIGGSSLNVMSVISKIHKEFGVNIKLSVFFKNQTIESQSKLIIKSVKTEHVRIPVSKESHYYPVTSSQKRMFIIQELDRSSKIYNMLSLIYLNSDISKETIKNIFCTIIKRHDSLRTNFEFKGEVPIQIIHEKVDFSIEEFELNSTNLSEIKNNFSRPFNLSTDTLIRVGFVNIPEHDNVLMIDMHHIISDALSINILKSEFYKLLHNETLKPLTIQYKDFAVWQNSTEYKEKIELQEKYWLDLYSNDIPVLNLPGDYTRPLTQSYEGKYVAYLMPKEETDSVKSFSEKQGITLYMSLLTVFTVLLSKLSNQEDVIIGTPVSGRNQGDLDYLVGNFVNTLAIRNMIRGDLTLNELIGEIKENVIKSFENQEYPFEDLVSKSSVKRDLGRNPIFDVMLNLITNNFSEESSEFINKIENRHKPSISEFDLSMTFIESGSQLMLNLNYSTKLFKEETIDQYIIYFRRILRGFSSNLDKKISDLELINTEEKQKLLCDFNNTKRDFPKDKSIHQLFETQVAKNPKNIALAFGTESITYSELNKKSNQLARYLKGNGVDVNDKIGLMVDRSIDFMVGILGILKTGGAYLPIDSTYPESRINYIISNSNSRIILTQKSHVDKIEEKLPIVILDELDLNKEEVSNLNVKIKSNNLSYVIYTSGSTGNPKGVQVEHSAVVNLLYFLQETYPLNENDSYLLKTSCSFDVSVSELFGWILGGGKLSILEKDHEKDPIKIIEAIDNYKITHINFVPTVFKLFSDSILSSAKNKLISLKYILIAGESLLKEHVHEFNDLNLDVEIANLYGPTEATVYTSHYTLSSNESSSILIGKPISNYEVYIVNRNNQIQPIGVPGELLIGGVGIARGYLHNEALTLEKFIENPFKEGERIYRTGDLARWLPDGNMEFMGRIDHQVKIRGFRIELGEIENVLLRHESIKECAVLSKEENGDKYLCAYIVAEEDFNQEEIHMYLTTCLPNYMIPAYFVQLKTLPLTSNGKINRKALPLPEVKAGDDYVAPSNKTEEKLVEIWSGLLNIAVEEISITASFFALGGHSLKVMTMVNIINKEFGVNYPLIEVFRESTILGIAAILNNFQVHQNEETDLEYEDVLI